MGPEHVLPRSFQVIANWQEPQMTQILKQFIFMKVVIKVSTFFFLICDLEKILEVSYLLFLFKLMEHLTYF